MGSSIEQKYKVKGFLVSHSLTLWPIYIKLPKTTYISYELQEILYSEIVENMAKKEFISSSGYKRNPMTYDIQLKTWPKALLQAEITKSISLFHVLNSINKKSLHAIAIPHWAKEKSGSSSPKKRQSHWINKDIMPVHGPPTNRKNVRILLTTLTTMSVFFFLFRLFFHLNRPTDEKKKKKPVQQLNVPREF